MTQKKWHFQIYACRKYTPTHEVLMFDSQTSHNDKVRRGFNNQLKAYREADMYAKLAYHPADENPICSAKILTFTVSWSELPGTHQVIRLLETVNALTTNGLPHITVEE